MRNHSGYGQNPFQPNFTICKSEGGTANCPSEYVKEFAGVSGKTQIAAFLIIPPLVGYSLYKLTDSKLLGVAVGAGPVIATGWFLTVIGKAIKSGIESAGTQ